MGLDSSVWFEMWNWLPPKTLDRRPSRRSAIFISTTSLTSWHSKSRSSGRRRRDRAKGNWVYIPSFAHRRSVDSAAPGPFTTSSFAALSAHQS
jgi:hypothetical protein